MTEPGIAPSMATRDNKGILEENKMRVTPHLFCKQIGWVFNALKVVQRYLMDIYRVLDRILANVEMTELFCDVDVGPINSALIII